MASDRGWLVPEPRRVQTPFSYPETDCRVLPVELAVVHFTMSPVSRSPHGSDELRIRRWLLGKGRESSTHFVALRDGSLFQGASVDSRTWHAGGSDWFGIRGINYRSIGLDLENVGPLARGTDRWVNGYGGTYRGPDPQYLGSHGHEPYRVAQMTSFLHIVSMLANRFPVLSDRERWVGHEEIRRGKGDPGHAFPWGALKEVLAGASPGSIDWDQYPGVIDA